jgi:hypothetical protein
MPHALRSSAVVLAATIAITILPAAAVDDPKP